VVVVAKYTEDELIEALKRLAEETDGRVSKEDVAADDASPSVGAYKDRFGSWVKAKRAVGLETERMQYSNEELLEELRRVAARVEGPVTQQDVTDDADAPGWMTYRRRFGSWAEAKEAAGLEPDPIEEFQRYTDEELKQMLREKADTCDDRVTRSDVDTDPDLPAAETFTKRFGSFNAARKAAGLATYGEGRGVDSQYSKQDLIEKLQHLAEVVEGSVTVRDLRGRDTMPAQSTFRRQFGSWQDAKDAANIE